MYEGVTTIRDVGSSLTNAAAVRDAIAAGVQPGPRVVLGGFQFYPFAGDSGITGDYRQEPRDPSAATRGLQLAEAFGASYAKMRWPANWTAGAALVKQAHHRGMSVSGHIAWPLAVVAAGIDGQEHLGPSGSRTERNVYDDVVQLYRAAGMWVVPTLVTASTIAIYKPWLEAMRSSTLKMHRAGVPVAAGTDRPSLPTALHEELKRLVEAGLTPLEAIRAATFDAARVLRAENEIGSLDQGRIADLLILDANPVDNIENTRKIATIIQAGRVVKIDRSETDADARAR